LNSLVIDFNLVLAGRDKLVASLSVWFFTPSGARADQKKNGNQAHS
jgi:hypothetical protein